MQVMKQPLEQFVHLLRSAAEPRGCESQRCWQPELSVSDIAAVLGQSQPRVPPLEGALRRGTAVADAGNRWIYYRLADTGAPGEFVRSTLESLDPPIRRSRSTSSAAALRARQRAKPRRRLGGAGPWQRARSSAPCSGAGSARHLSALLICGRRPIAVAPALANRVNRAVVLVTSREHLDRARKRLNERGPAVRTSCASVIHARSHSPPRASTR